MSYVITVFVIALALGASASLHAWPPIGAEVQSWHYDSATNIVTLKIINTSHKDIIAFNIAIKETYADGRVEEHEMLEELVGKIILAAKESFRKQFGDGAFHPSEVWMKNYLYSPASQTIRPLSML
ncbi:MAG TPA: hypothetical protein VG097_09170 [Gemmata sp.]|nr:hypothetical protein [Gemmata sp.]